MQHLTSPDPVGMGAVAPQVEHSIPYGDKGQIYKRIPDTVAVP